ncbi:MAG: hypothetical protein ACOCP8_02005 [archaeon]
MELQIFKNQAGYFISYEEEFIHDNDIMVDANLNEEKFNELYEKYNGKIVIAILKLIDDKKSLTLKQRVFNNKQDAEIVLEKLNSLIMANRLRGECHERKYN